jgi:hypothetical protein
MALISGDHNLFAAPPHLDPSNGELSFTPARDMYGNTTWEIVLVDSGGAEKRGHTRGNNVSLSKRFSISLISVNDAPSFELKSSVTVLASSTVVSYLEAGVAFNISSGAPNEAHQSVSFNVYTLTRLSFNPWISKPKLGPGGTLELQVYGNESFEAHLEISLTDDGGTGYGGADTSAVKNLTIYVIARPVAVEIVTMVQTIENQLDVAWEHLDVMLADNALGRTEQFVLELSKDCLAYTLTLAEYATCTSFKRSLTIGIEDCKENLCGTTFTDLDAAARYSVSVMAENKAGKSPARYTAAYVIQAPTAPNSVMISQLPTRSVTSSLLKIEWER